MRGEPIESVNIGLRSMMAALRQNPYALETVHLSIVTFDSEIKEVLPLTAIETATVPEIVCPQSGATLIGAGLEFIVEKVHREVRRTSSDNKGDWRPLLFVLTDGKPTDVLAYKEVVPRIKACGFGNIIGRSPAIVKVFELIKRVAELNVSVLIAGESGTGKELVARAVHYSGSRHDKPFVPVNCGAIPESLMESELFGYKKGAFTGAQKDKKGLFEEARTGTIFLDEIGDLPLHLQVKLLRILEDKKVRPLGSTDAVTVDVRVIAATNKKLEEEVTAGRFREDLFYRLNVIKIVLPALRERRIDVSPLAIHFINKYSLEMGKDIRGISPKALEVLENYHYPGNVRELENIIARCVALESSNVIRQETLPQLVTGKDYLDLDTSFSSNSSLDTLLGDVERKMIEKALRTTNGNKTEAARLLGITLRSLRYRLAKHELDDDGDGDVESMVDEAGEL